jgi:hypothetical protein
MHSAARAANDGASMPDVLDIYVVCDAVKQTVVRAVIGAFGAGT